MNQGYTTNPIIALLALSAYGRAFPIIPETVWVGLEKVIPICNNEEDSRVPLNWIRDWSDTTKSMTEESLKQPFILKDFNFFDEKNLKSTKKNLKFGCWKNNEEFLWNIIPTSDISLHDSFSNLKVVGIQTSEQTSFYSDSSFLETIGFFKEKSNAQVWWQVSPSVLNHRFSLETSPYLFSERVGVSLFLCPFKNGITPEYKNALINAAYFIGKKSNLEQWIFPVCEIIECCFYDFILFGELSNSKTPPSHLSWMSDWPEIKKSVWESFIKGFGGQESACIELMCAYALNKTYPLFNN